MLRPRAIRRLSLILTLLGLSALGGVVVIPWGRPLPIAPQLLLLDPVVTGWIIFGAAALYCGATLLCAFALWRMRPWAPQAYLGFAATVATFLALHLLLVRIPTPLALEFLFVGLLGGALYWGWRIVHNTFGTTAKAL
jgi:hypothetical protein